MILLIFYVISIVVALMCMHHIPIPGIPCNPRQPHMPCLLARQYSGWRESSEIRVSWSPSSGLVTAPGSWSPAGLRQLFNSSLGGKEVGCLGGIQSRWEGGGKSGWGREVKCKIESTSAVILLLNPFLNLVLSLNPDSDPGS